MTEPEPVESVLRFWFGDVTQDIGAAAKSQEKLWWSGGGEIDERIRQRFGAVHAQAIRGELDAWPLTARGRLALILVLDQFSRNIYRGTPSAFAQDDAARRQCIEGLDAGEDRQLGLLERVFLYLPLEHSESRADQVRSVALYEALTASVPDPLRELFEHFAKFARDHRDVIERFGRFPHRNRIVGRESTAEELAFLQQPGSSF